MKASTLQIGVITGTHGIRGQVKVMPTTDAAERFLSLDEVIIRRPDGAEETRRILSARLHKGQVLLLLEGLEDINLVEDMKGAVLLVTRDQAVPLNANEYYYADLIGMRVLRTDGEEAGPLGELIDIMETGANDVFVIRREDGRELLIPAIAECIRQVDVEAGNMLVTLLPGMEEM